MLQFDVKLQLNIPRKYQFTRTKAVAPIAARIVIPQLFLFHILGITDAYKWHALVKSCCATLHIAQRMHSATLQSARGLCDSQLHIRTVPCARTRQCFTNLVGTISFISCRLGSVEPLGRATAKRMAIVVRKTHR